MAKLIDLNPSGERLISAVASRLASLLQDEPKYSRQALMEESETRMIETGMWDGVMPESPSPEEFSWCLIEANPWVREHLSNLMWEFQPELIETVGDLIAHILPGDGSLD